MKINLANLNVKLLIIFTSLSSIPDKMLRDLKIFFISSLSQFLKSSIFSLVIKLIAFCAVLVVEF